MTGSFKAGRRAIALALLASVALATPVAAQLNPAPPTPAQDTSLPPEERARDLVSRMTLEEKVPQLMNDAPAINRLGVREYNWWNEGLHGVAAGPGFATVFPQAIGMAATWNAPLHHKAADLISREFRARNLAYQHRFGGSDWFTGLTVWSPNINIFRDPRWGRGQETYGEDPYLTGKLGVAFVTGLQGDDPNYLRTVATPKHYAVHSGPEPSRHRDNFDISEHDMHDTYLPAFRATVVDGNAQSVMCAYNSVNGQPACANTELLVTNLRQNWGFTGYVVSDCDALGNVYRENQHHYAKTPEEGAKVSFEAGMDLVCGGDFEIEHILSAVRTGVLDESVIDRALVRLFTARMKLGQFDPAERVFPDITKDDYDTPENRALSQQVAEQSMVLLKNQGNLLPLKAAPRSIAVVGPNGDDVDALVGNYNGTPSHPITLVAGLKARYPDAKVEYVEGSDLTYPAMAPVPDSAFCRDARCSAPGLTLATFDNRGLEGKAISTERVANATKRWDGRLVSTSTRWTGFIKAPETGEYTFRLNSGGGYRIWVGEDQIVNSWQLDYRPSIAAGTVALQAGKIYPIKIESYQRGTEGNDTLVWAKPGDDGLNAAVAAARNADLVVFAGGLTHELEGEESRVEIDGFSGGDRTSTDLPAVQQKLLESVVATGKPVVAVLMNGSALSVNWADANVPAIVEAWYPGGSGGAAIARLIAGDYSPAGRLPVTFYKSVDDLPPFSDYSMDGRTYRYFEGEALYPFGYGLSYTDFSYAKPKVSAARVKADGKITVSVDVTNAGAMDGDEVVQLYATHPGVPGAPERALVGFERVSLKKGETRTVSFTLADRDLSIVDPDGKRRIVPGTVQLWVGGGQQQVRSGLKPTAGAATSFELTTGKVLAD